MGGSVSPEADDQIVRLVGAEVLTDGGFERQDLTLAGGRIAGSDQPPGRAIDLEGLCVLPGLVDLHGDGFERHLAPRRGMVTNLVRGLFAVETELASVGVTTAWLAQFWSWEGGMRGPAFAQRLATALDDARPRLTLDLRLQLRVERSMVDDASALREIVARHQIGFAVFNDHLPYEHLDSGRTPPRLAGSAGKAARSPEAHHAEMKRLARNRPDVASFVETLATEWVANGVCLGSHDDTSAQERARWSALGLGIAEFPVARDAAEAAGAQGAPIVLGAPNVVRGGSHKRGGISAEDLVADGLCDALASDYHYPAMAQAAFALSDRGVLAMPEAWALVSRRPAEVMGMTDRGWIAAGQRADLVVIDPDDRRVAGVFVQGRPVFATTRLTAALMAS